MKGVQRLLAPMQHRIRMMIGRAVIAAVDDGTTAQSLQLDLLADETADGVERFHDYGFTSVPHPGAEALVAFVGGLRSHGVVVAVGDRKYRMKGMTTGEVALYDDLGQYVLLGRDAITIMSPNDITIEGVKVTVVADHAVIEAGRIDLGGEGGAKVARVGDPVDLGTGLILEGSEQVFAT